MMCLILLEVGSSMSYRRVGSIINRLLPVLYLFLGLQNVSIVHCPFIKMDETFRSMNTPKILRLQMMKNIYSYPSNILRTLLLVAK